VVDGSRLGVFVESSEALGLRGRTQAVSNVTEMETLELLGGHGVLLRMCGVSTLELHILNNGKNTIGNKNAYNSMGICF
jgi:hypothetical protein